MTARGFRGLDWAGFSEGRLLLEGAVESGGGGGGGVGDGIDAVGSDGVGGEIGPVDEVGGDLDDGGVGGALDPSWINLD